MIEDIEGEAKRGRQVLNELGRSKSEIEKIIAGWMCRAKDYNSRFYFNANTPDDRELVLVQRFRNDPLGLVGAILDDPIAGPRIRTELAELPDLMCHTHLTRHHLKLVRNYIPKDVQSNLENISGLSHKGAKKGVRSTGAIGLFERIVKALRRKSFGDGRTFKSASHVDLAIRAWLEPVYLTRLPPCLLNNKALQLVFLPGHQDNRARTAISNWKLPRPQVKDRLELPNEVRTYYEITESAD